MLGTVEQFRIGNRIGNCLCTIYHNGKAKVMVVDSLWVDENHRRQGIGTSIMKKAIDAAKNNNVDAVELVVNNDNEVAKELYRKAGFKYSNKERYSIILNEK